MGSVNKCFLIGNLGAKPELKVLTNGQSVCELRLAMNESWTDKNGAKQERVEWISVVVWGKTGENCAKYLDRGRQVCVEGKLQTRSWDDKTTGEKRYKTEVVANSVTFLGTGKTDRTAGENFQESVQDTTNPAVSDDNIPF